MICRLMSSPSLPGGGEHGSHYKEVPGWVDHEARTPVEQMLCLILPGYKGKGRSRGEPETHSSIKLPGFFILKRGAGA